MRGVEGGVAGEEDALVGGIGGAPHGGDRRDEDVGERRGRAGADLDKRVAGGGDVAVSHAKAGVAASLMSLSPILVIPIVLARGERVGWAGVVGAVLAVGGVAILALA